MAFEVRELNGYETIGDCGVLLALVAVDPRIGGDDDFVGYRAKES
jgi:hypothetical protein